MRGRVIDGDGGAVAVKAATIKLPDPSKIRIKGPDQFTLIGTEQKKPGRSAEGHRQGHLRHRCQPARHALCRREKRVRCSAAPQEVYDFGVVKDRPGVHSAVAIEGRGPRENANYGTSGKGVSLRRPLPYIADTWWQAKTALDAMPIEWDVGPNGNPQNSDELLQAYLKSLEQPGTIVLEDGGSYAAAKSAPSAVPSIETSFHPDSASGRCPPLLFRRGFEPCEDART